MVLYRLAYPAYSWQSDKSAGTTGSTRNKPIHAWPMPGLWCIAFRLRRLRSHLHRQWWNWRCWSGGSRKSISGSSGRYHHGFHPNSCKSSYTIRLRYSWHLHRKDLISSDRKEYPSRPGGLRHHHRSISSDNNSRSRQPARHLRLWILRCRQHQ